MLTYTQYDLIWGENDLSFFGKFVQHIGEHFEVKNSELEVTNNTVIFKFQR